MLCSLNLLQNRYTELHRMTRQWLHMKEHIEHGFAHNGKTPGEGELAWFCCACPQPDINYKRKEPDDERRWLGHHSYVCDGCFTLVHQRFAKGENDVTLKDGEGFLVCSHRFEQYLADVRPVETVSVNPDLSTRVRNPH